jgi:co-chaperonin GroES (HSP10)
MALNLNTIKGQLRPIKDHVIVEAMHFGEQTTKSGLILRDDNGTGRGIYPRWGCIYAKGPENNEEYNVGDWVLIEHGRWTRGLKMDDGDSERELRRVEPDSILAFSNEKPSDVMIGIED